MRDRCLTLSYISNKEKLEVIVLGCDPSSTNQKIIFETVFDIGNPMYEDDFRRNPYFRDIMLNLICIFEEDNPVNFDEVFETEKTYDRIYVQNLCPDYLEKCTGYYKSKWSKWIKNDSSGAGYVRTLKTELDNLDPDRKLPVLLTSSYLLEALVDRRKIKGRDLKFRSYYQGYRGFIDKEENDLERVLIPFSRNRQAGYMLESEDNKKYCERIKNYLRNNRR